MAIRAPNPYEGYPPGWGVLDQLGPSGYAAIGFSRDLPYARRFGARYRFARSVTEIVLNGYASAETRAGYASLARVAFTYSAFESMLELIGVPRKGAHAVLSGHPVSRWLGELRAIDPGCTLIRFVADRIEPKHERAQLAQFLDDRACDVSAIAGSIRHIFFHGELTPNAGGGDPLLASKVCDHLTAVLFEVIDREFEARVEPHRH